MKIEFDHYDLQITTTQNGDRVVQIRAAKAFDEDFIKEMEDKGVREFVREEEGKSEKEASEVPNL